MHWNKSLIPVLILMMACSPQKVDDNSTGEILKALEPGDFRGVNMGDLPDEVMSVEGKNYVYALPDELTYRIPLDQQDSTWYEITYNFNEEGLYDIMLEIYPKDDSQRVALADDFGKLYQQRYGTPAHDGNYLKWKVMTAKNGRIVRIVMNDSLEKNGIPYLKINFNEYNR
ncbi:MAG: hypothetical protein SH856_11785 [Flavobacteriales bacterium]|nr:hypothetical protein [Flavobacteriales bacterium]